METARFSLRSYVFDKINLDLEGIGADTSLNIRFAPSGVFHSNKSEYVLQFEFEATSTETSIVVVHIRCSAHYLFTNVKSFEDVPDYFFNNAIAILFPYVRAFVSTVTLQANVQPLMLPTLNLSSLQENLKNNTIVQD